MGLLHYPHRFASDCVARIGNAFGWQRLPTRFNGRWLVLPAKDWTSLVSTYEPYIATAMVRHLKRGDVVFDIGAHAGLWSAFAAKFVGNRGLVVACEPSPAYSLLLHTAKGYRQLRPLRIGLGAKNGTMMFHAQGSSRSGSFIRRVTDINAHHQPEVPITEVAVTLRQLDSIVDELRVTPSLIKVDVEGFELDVLKGAQKTLSLPACIWIIEVHPPQLCMSGGSEAALKEMLEREGYRIEIVDRNPNSLYTLVATKAAKAISRPLRLNH
jgi:FkbM family methyltransferase